MSGPEPEKMEVNIGNNQIESKTKKNKDLNMSKITVLFPIKVPDSKYCWNQINHEVCNYFDSEGGHSNCELGFYNQKDSNEGTLKPNECLNLKKI